MPAHIKDNEAAIADLSLREDPWRKLCARASNVPGASAAPNSTTSIAGN